MRGTFSRSGNVALAEIVKSVPILGACLFGTEDGLQHYGIGCLPKTDFSLLRTLEMRGLRLARDEYCWFSVPVVVEGAVGAMVGLTSFARDRRARDGIAGVAVVQAGKWLESVGFAGVVLLIEKLHNLVKAEFVDDVGIVNLAKAESVLQQFPAVQPGKVLLAAHEPLQIKLTPSWPCYISLPELLSLLSWGLTNASVRPGFVLRDHSSAQAHFELTQEFFADWHSNLRLGSKLISLPAHSPTP